MFPDTIKLCENLYESKEYHNFFTKTFSTAKLAFKDQQQKLVFIYASLLWPCFLMRFNEASDASLFDHFNQAMTDTFNAQHSKVFLDYNIQNPIKLLWCQYLQQKHSIDDIFVSGFAREPDMRLKDAVQKPFLETVAVCPLIPELSQPAAALEKN